MLFFAFICSLIWFVTSFVVVADMFRRHTALGCLGLILLPVIPFAWVIKGYSGSKRKVGALLYGSAVVAIALFAYEWRSASKHLEPFAEASSAEGVELSLKSIRTHNGATSYTVVSRTAYEPGEPYASVDEMHDPRRVD